MQQEIVTDDREQVNMLVLAGPGSGKTRVLVHRIAYLVRVRRENPHGILALAGEGFATCEISPDATLVRAGPVMIGGDVNRKLAPHGRKIGPGRVGPVTEKFIRHFRARTHNTGVPMY